MAQVAAGLTAIQNQNLVHRDIKPTNIMVSLAEGNITAKIIDLGLAKVILESLSNAPISTLGAFVGTPEFASPEQFANRTGNPLRPVLTWRDALRDEQPTFC